VEGRARPEPEGAAEHAGGEVDRERQVGDAALDVAPELGRQHEQQQRAGEHRGAHVSPEQPRDRADEGHREQCELRAQHAHVGRPDGLHVEARHDRPPERVVGHAEDDVVPVRDEQPLVEPVVPEGEPLRQPDPPRVVEPGRGAEPTDDPDRADPGDEPERGTAPGPDVGGGSRSK
jgi:hypothetical protein